MQVNRYLRLAFVLTDNNSQTLRKNLEKMIALVLYDAGEEFDSNRRQSESAQTQPSYGYKKQRFPGLEVSDIITGLKNSYSLEFSDNEVYEAIKKNNEATIIRVPDSHPDTYNITPAERDRIEHKVDDKTLDKLIDEFFTYEESLNVSDRIDDLDFNQAIDNIQNKEVIQNFSEESKGVPSRDISSTNKHEKFKDLLYQYFYMLFNSNASVMQSFLGKNYDQIIKISDSEFTEPQKRLINTFLYWENAEKDRFVYQMVSCCYDYCVMTVGKSTRNYNQVFNNKIFYLDTNVIFRLMGLNHENRRKIIHAFIDKCKEVKITIQVTNFTRKELEDTIKHHVANLRNVLGDNRPTDHTSSDFYTYGFCNPGFYEAYEDWCKDKLNTVGDYNSFTRYLKRQASDVISQFKNAECDAFKGDEYSELVHSLLEYKQSNRRKAYEESVKIDVSNYLFVKRMNGNTGSVTFLDTHHYMISTDHAFGDWARIQRPGTVPIVVLPSVWYSIILQYTGRNEDDYTAFTRFLNFSLGDGDNAQNGRDEKKILIFRKVLSKQEPNDIKNEVLFDIEERLKKEPKLTDDEPDDFIDQIVDESLESVTQRREREAREDERRKADIEKADYQKQLKSFRIKSEAAVNAERAETERIKNEFEDYKKSSAEKETQAKKTALMKNENI